MKTLMTTLVLGLSLALVTPTSAFAKNEFEDAFKGELGRIAARHAAHGGRHLLSAILLGPRHHAAGHGSGGHHGHYDRGHHYGHAPYHHGYRHHDYGHGHGHHCDH